MQPTIKVENLSKLYRLGEIGTGTLSRDIERWWYIKTGKEDPFSKIGQVNDRRKSVETNLVWALNQISFEVEKGEVLGIIGRNGAGKSTLLKLLSKITAPTSGRIYINGRIASLLEVGTGFHPEMTGRENIYMNGALLGMFKREIDKKFDEIVDFAGVEAYIDTPVKRYSSGMYVRLAFAVAAFLEPEILIVDEVLAVGDAEFQKKCIGRMKDVSVNDGRTVLFVSHNIDAIKALCTKGLLLKNGGMVYSGGVKEALSLYNSNLVAIKSNSDYISKNKNDKAVIISRAKVLVNNGNTKIYSNGDQFQIEVELQGFADILVSLEILVKDQNNTPILFSPTGLVKGFKTFIKDKEKRKFLIDVRFPYLACGDYFIDLMLVESGIQFFDYVENALSFEVESSFIQESSWTFTQKRGQGAILLTEIFVKEL